MSLQGKITAKGENVVLTFWNVPSNGKYWTLEFTYHRDEFVAGLVADKLNELLEEHMRQVRYESYRKGLEDGQKLAVKPKAKRLFGGDMSGCFNG